jgi:acyl dehydratase
MRELGFDDIMAHGWLTFAHMCRVVQSWAPPEAADITAYGVKYRRTVYAGLSTYGGVVIAVRNDEADLDRWAKNPAGDLTATAVLTVRFI